MKLLAKVHCRLPSIRDGKTCSDRVVEFSDVELFNTVHVLWYPRFGPDRPVDDIQGGYPEKESEHENNVEDIESLAQHCNFRVRKGVKTSERGTEI